MQEDQYKLQIQQFTETKQLQQDQLTANENFWAENKKLSEDAVTLQRAQFVESNKLQMESAGLQAEEAKYQKQVNDLLLQQQKYQGDVNGLLQNLNEVLLVDLIKQLGLADPALQALIQQIQRLQGAALGGSAAGWGGEGKPQASGGWLNGASGLTLPGLMSGRTAVVGEGGFEFVHGNRVMSHAESQSRLDQYMNRQIISSGGGSGRTVQQPINVYVGNELLQSFIINAVVKDMNN